MSNLIETCGARYVTEFCQGAAFLYEGNVHVLRDAADTYVRAWDVENGNRPVNVPAEFFTGWKAFATPTMGYRRLGPHKVGYVSRRNGTRRGLRADSLNIEWTPATSLLTQLRNDLFLMNNEAKLVAVMKPTFDTIEEHLPELLSGDRLSVVLNENIVIEAATGGHAAHWYNVLFRQHTVGRLDRRGRVIWDSAEHTNLIPTLTAA